jgi:thiamine-phosphate pyrophosphorylase
MKVVPRLHAVTDDQVACLPNLASIAGAIALSENVALHARLPGADGARMVELAAILGASRAKSRLLVNDRIDVARIAGANGVHLPENGLPVSVARQLLDDRQLLGRSVHRPEDVRRAVDEGVDYVFLGPVWPTTSHPERPALGLRAFRGLGTFPVIAIGGITPDRARQCRDAGAWGVAAISALWRAGDPAATARAMLLSFEK